MTARWPEDEDDTSLMQKTALGDHAAFQRLVARHLPAAVRTAARILGATAEADDVVQEAFIRVWKHAPTWATPEQAGARFTTWLYRIVLNLAIDHKRKRRDTADTDITTLPDHDDNAETALARREQSQQVQAAIAALPERQRTAFILCFYEEHSNKDAANIMEISVKALESLLVRARKTLHGTLSKERVE